MTVRPSEIRSPEPSLVDLLDDSVLQTLMARDRVSRRALEDLIRQTRQRLAVDAEAAALSAQALYEATVFAECRS
jgi:hypothetical protein